MKKNAVVTQFLVCAGLVAFCFGGQAYGADKGKESPHPKKDIYLSVEALCGEDMPFFKDDYIPPKEYTKTKIDNRSLYLSVEALCGEDPSRSYKLIIPANYVRVKHDPKDLELDLEKMISEDPSFVKGQEKY